MEAVYEELDEVKSEIEKLREQLRAKTELAESLRKANDDQLGKNEAISSQLDKLSRELNEKDDELFSAKKMNEELRSNLKEKESFVKHITTANDKLRADGGASSVEIEMLSRVLNEREDELFAAKKSNEDLKLIIKEKESVLKNLSDRICSSKEESLKLEKMKRELSDKEDEIFNARRLSDELKSKLKEKELIVKQVTCTNDKLRLECSEKVRNHDEENKALAFALDDANSKNADQEQQIRALKEEIEGIRRSVSVSQKKLSETGDLEKASKKEVEQREDVFLKLEEDNRKFEDQLKWKKEQFGHLEESHTKLRSEFKAREKEWEKQKSALIDDLSSLQAKFESQARISQDFQRRLEMCEQALAHSESKRKILEAEIFESRSSFDSMCCEYDQAKLNFEALASKRDQELANLRSCLSTKEIPYKEMEYQFRRVEQEKHDLLSSLKELQEDQIREARVSSSASKLQNKLKSLEREHRGCSANLREKELEWKLQMEKLARELDTCMSELKSQDVTIGKLKTELEACDSLMPNLEILSLETSLMLLVMRSEFSEAANSYMDLKGQEMQENMRALIERLEKKEFDLSDMGRDLEEERDKVSMLSEKVRTLEELQLPLQKEKESLSRLLEESSTSRVRSDERTVQLQSDLDKVNEALERANEELYEKSCEANEIEFELHLWKSVAEQLEATVKVNNQMRREVEASLLAQIEVETNLKQEKESLSHLLEEKERKIEDLQQQLVEASHNGTKDENSTTEEMEDSLRNLFVGEGKDHRIGDLQQLVTSLENEFESSTSSFCSRLSRMQKETSSLRESREKIKEAVIMKEIEIQEKNLIIQELENELEGLVGPKLIRELEEKTESSNQTIQKLTDENKKLLSVMNFLSDRIERLAAEDSQLMENLGKIVRSFGAVWNGDDDDVFEQENAQVFSSPSVKKGDTVYEERSPFRPINT